MPSFIGRYGRLLCDMSDVKMISSKRTKADNSMVVFCFHKVFKEIFKNTQEEIENKSTEHETYFYMSEMLWRSRLNGTLL